MRVKFMSKTKDFKPRSDPRNLQSGRVFALLGSTVTWTDALVSGKSQSKNRKITHCLISITFNIVKKADRKAHLFKTSCSYVWKYLQLVINQSIWTK